MDNRENDDEDKYSKKLKENVRDNHMTPSIGTLECNSKLKKTLIPRLPMRIKYIIWILIKTSFTN